VFDALGHRETATDLVQRYVDPELDDKVQRAPAALIESKRCCAPRHLTGGGERRAANGAPSSTPRRRSSPVRPPSPSFASFYGFQSRIVRLPLSDPAPLSFEFEFEAIESTYGYVKWVCAVGRVVPTG
jgi:hypothetical protein